MSTRALTTAALMFACSPLVAQQPFPLEPGGESAHGDSAMSFDGTNFLVFFEDDRGIQFNRELYAMLVSPAGIPQSPLAFMVSSGPYTGYPDACFGAGQHLVVYEGAWGGGAVPQVICTRVLPDGTVLDPNGIAVWSNQQTGHAFRPQAASNGQKIRMLRIDTANSTRSGRPWMAGRTQASRAGWRGRISGKNCI